MIDALLHKQHTPYREIRFGLRVTAAKPSYILAMKLKALERATIDNRDYEDAVNLGIECGVSA